MENPISLQKIRYKWENLSEFFSGFLPLELTSWMDSWMVLGKNGKSGGERPKNSLLIFSKLQQKSPINWLSFFERKTRLELATPTLARSCSTNWATSAWCVVVLPLMYLGRDLNPHDRNDQGILSPSCLPIPPPRQLVKEPSQMRLQKYTFFACKTQFQKTFFSASRNWLKINW